MDEIERLAQLINENIDDHSDEYEGLDDEDEFYDEDEDEPFLIDSLIFKNGDHADEFINGPNDSEYVFYLNGVEYIYRDDCDDNPDHGLNKAMLIHKDELIEKAVDAGVNSEYIRHCADRQCFADLAVETLCAL